MILWLTGNTGAGKTTLARKLKNDRTIILDGDELRETINRDLDLSKQDRIENNYRIARLAKLLSDQGFDIIVAVICPYEEVRQKIKQMINCRFIYLPYKGDDKIKNCPYERPHDPDIQLTERVL